MIALQPMRIMTILLCTTTIIHASHHQKHHNKKTFYSSSQVSIPPAPVAVTEEKILSTETITQNQVTHVIAATPPITPTSKQSTPPPQEPEPLDEEWNNITADDAKPLQTAPNTTESTAPTTPANAQLMLGTNYTHITLPEQNQPVTNGLWSTIKSPGCKSILETYLAYVLRICENGILLTIKDNKLEKRLPEHISGAQEEATNNLEETHKKLSRELMQLLQTQNADSTNLQEKHNLQLIALLEQQRSCFKQHADVADTVLSAIEIYDENTSCVSETRAKEGLATYTRMLNVLQTKKEKVATTYQTNTDSFQKQRQNIKDLILQELECRTQRLQCLQELLIDVSHLKDSKTPRVQF